MKKILTAGCLSVLFSVYAFAGLGVSFNGGYRSGDHNFNDVDTPSYGGFPGSGSASGDSSNDFIMLQASIFYESSEIFKLGEKHIFGAFAGYSHMNAPDFSYGGINVPHYNMHLAIDIEGYRIPLGIYYKYKASRKIALRSGIGATYVKSTWKRELSDYYGGNMRKSETDENVLMPRIDAGFEWLLTKVFTLGVDFSYTMNGKIKNPYDTPWQSEEFYVDSSGFSASLALRFYILQ